MTTLRKALPSLLLALVALWVLSSHQARAQSQNDCTAFTTTVTGNATGQTVPNLSQNAPCVNWRLTFSSTGTLSTTVTFQTSPDNSTWTAVPNTVCSSTVQPPCILQGANPTTGTQGTAYLSAYGAYVRVITSGSSGSGTATIRVYGAKGATANASIGGGGGGTGTVTDTLGPLTLDAVILGNGGSDIKPGAVLPGDATKYYDGTGNFSTPPSTGTLIYYFTNTASSIATYLQATSLPYSPKTTLSFAGLATGTDTLKNWSTNAGVPGVAFIPQGIFVQHIHALRTGGGTVTLHAQIWEVDAAGVDIAMIGQTEDTPALGTAEIQYDLDYVSSAPYIPVSSASRIVSRIFAVVSGSAPTVQIFVGGTADTRLGLPSNTIDATNFVPYTGAVLDVNLGTHKISGNAFTFTGASSGAATVQAAAAQGTPNPIQPPTSTGAPGTFLQTDGGNPQQLSWAAGGASGVTFATASVLTAVPSPADVWIMNEGSGNTFADTSGTANTITAGGTVTWGSGPGGCNPCAHFPGTFSSISANHTNFNPGSTSPFSVSTWISFDNPNNLEIIVAQFFVGGNNPGWYFYKNDSIGGNELIGVLVDSAGGLVSNTWYPPLTTNKLYHLVMTADGTHTSAGLKMWMNGVLLQLITVVSDNLNGSMTSNSNINIGSWPLNTNDRHVGYQANTQLYNHALTQAEVLTLYYAGPTSYSFTQATRSAESVQASSFATLDADCGTGAKLGGGTATDNTVKLNAVLASASATAPLELVMDGCSVVTGLFLPQAGHVAIRGTGWDSGLFVKSGSNASAISDGFPIFPSGAVPARGANIKLSHMRINGNRGTFPNGNSTVGDARGVPFIATIDISGINGLLLDDLWIYDSPAYNYHGGNVSNVVADRLKIEAPGFAINTDALHFDGPADHIRISNLYCSVGDDCIALNAPEGYGGIIDNVSVNNLQLAAGSFGAMRAYSYVPSGFGIPTTRNFAVQNVTVNNVAGTTTAWGFILTGQDNSASKTIDELLSFKISNVTLTTPKMFVLGDPIGELNVSNATLMAPTATNPFFSFGQTTAPISSLICSHCKIYRSTVGNAAATFLQVSSPNTIKRLVLDDVSIENEQGQSYGAIAALIDVPSGGAITELDVQHVDPANITALVTAGSYARVTNVAGDIRIPMAVAALPTCNAASEGATARVSNALTPVSLAAVVGGGAVRVPVACDGTNWIVQ